MYPNKKELNNRKKQVQNNLKTLFKEERELTKQMSALETEIKAINALEDLHREVEKWRLKKNSQV